MCVVNRRDRGYMTHGVKCRSDNISERKENWYFIKSSLINIHDARLPKIKKISGNWSYFYDTIVKEYIFDFDPQFLILRHLSPIETNKETVREELRYFSVLTVQGNMSVIKGSHSRIIIFVTFSKPKSRYFYALRQFTPDTG